jgi:uncharacterized protein
MNTLTDSPPPMELAPVPADKRIQALDVARGFALIGICMMNVEFFNRAMATLGQGMPQGLTGANWLASFFVAYFVTGKFWTIFSFLFGMGFAVMLTRAETAGRGFLKPYLRRIAALAAFGAFHHIFIWAGDILFSYAVAAVFLLLVLYGTWKWMVGAIVVLIGMAFIPGFGPGAGSSAVATAFAGLLALYMRNEKLRLKLPLMSLILLIVGVIAVVAAAVMNILALGPADARPVPVVLSVVLLVLAYLSSKYHNPISQRAWRAGAGVYLFSFTMMTSLGLVDYLRPPEAPVPAAALDAARIRLAAEDAAQKAPKAEVKAAPKADAKADPKAAAVKKPEPTPAEQAADREAQREKRMKERVEQEQTEIKAMTGGSYAEAVTVRAKNFAEHAPTEPGFATILIGMFLLGTWFIRSGVMENTGAHLPLFRKLAFIGLPFGIGLGLLGALITVRHLPGAQHDGYQFATGLLMLGNLPASIGYVSMLVLMLHSASGLSKVRVLAPFGRMALTNYLMQSVIGSLFFYGYGLGHWGMDRSLQLVYVAVLCAGQIAFSHWWLSQFRYGPMEWLWRAITYMKIPPMRIGAPAGPLQVQPSQ